ncbi:hypothetical protein PBRA_003299 [Plasmodiophora brassicae]|uniref:Trimethylguanosine synthase n=1 Tax=Plasmodiophora brassicae TaxID=37360 RepID=A0A0G4J871_PLABS|nr:hypothetical protein PBRA_003299 [Plasmodiophora brassicae]
MVDDAEAAIRHAKVRIEEALSLMPPRDELNPIKIARYYHDIASAVAAKSGVLFSDEDIEMAARRDQIRDTPDTSSNVSTSHVCLDDSPVGFERQETDGTSGAAEANGVMDGFTSRFDRPETHPTDTMGHNVDVKKYFNRRHVLFSLYDDGVVLDRESWYSVTPESIARHIARRAIAAVGEWRSGRNTLVAVEGFCGAGGNAIALAFEFDHVIAVDYDKEKLAAAWTNASIYGVAHKITFVHADFIEIAPKLAGCADVVYMCPPWSGPGYIHQRVYDLKTIQPDMVQIMTCARTISDNIVISLPRNTNLVRWLQVIASSR